MVMPKEIRTVMSIVISIGIIAFTILFLYILINNIPSSSVPTELDSASDTILSDNGTANTLGSTPDGDVVTTTAKNRTWLEFDGVDDEVDLGSPVGTRYNFSIADDFSISIWVNATENQESISNIQFRDGSNNREKWRVFLINGNLSFQVGASSFTYCIVNKSIEINDSLWRHVAVRKNSTGSFIYVDSSLIGQNNTCDSSGGIAQGNSLKLGGIYDDNKIGDGKPFNGSIDEFRIYNRTITLSEITEIYNSGRIRNASLPTDGLAIWLPINENAGLNVYSINETLDSTIHSSSVSGATWNNDGIDNTLTQDTDYSVSGTTFTIINQEYAWNELSLSWNFPSSETRDAFDDIQSNYSLSVLNISIQFPTIGTIVGIVILLAILIALLVFVITKLMGITEDTKIINVSRRRKFNGSGLGVA